MEAQSLSVKRAEVEFHKFASFGEPERALASYAEENKRRGGLIRKHADFIGSLSPFLELGANAGHTSYMLANEFGAEGFALDLSADALRYGIEIQRAWELERAPVRVAGDALRLPFRDNSLKFVMAYQILSQFMNIESVFLEVKRVLVPGGVFLFSEEPLLRLLSLRLYRCPYYHLMKPWERKLHDWGLLGYLVRDVIGAEQEESFGIRQNHTMYLKDWQRLVAKHFSKWEFDPFVPERGPGEQIVKNLAIHLDPHRSLWRAAHLLGGTLGAVCRKAGEPAQGFEPVEDFETYLRCPDCFTAMQKDGAGTLHCSACEYTAPVEGGVYNLLPSREKSVLYPGDREDLIDFSLPGHETRLLDGWHELEGVYGNRYRWIGERASAQLKNISGKRQRLRVRGYAHQDAFKTGKQVMVAAAANGRKAGEVKLDRPGLFVLEAELPEAGEYRIDITASPHWRAPGDGRTLSVNISMIRLVPAD